MSVPPSPRPPGSRGPSKRILGSDASVEGNEANTEQKDLRAECERLRAQRDYYRRRWYVHGVNYGHFYLTRGSYVSAVMGVLVRARQKDGDSSGS